MAGLVHIQADRASQSSLEAEVIGDSFIAWTDQGSMYSGELSIRVFEPGISEPESVTVRV